MAVVLDVLSWIFLITGSFFAVVGGIGLIRLPDFYSRIHAGGITDTLGAGLILTGLMFQSGLSLVTAKLVMVLFFLLLTSPTSAHALAQVAGAAMSADTIKLSARRVCDLPLPVDHGAWQAGGDLAREAFVAEDEETWRNALERLGATMERAYGTHDRRALDWWLRRLPPWR